MKARYSRCAQMVETPDFFLVYPFQLRLSDPALLTERIRAQWTEIQSLSGVLPTEKNRDRVIIGYRHPDDEGGKDCHPGYWRHSGTPFINIPWGMIGIRDQPLEALSHELVHVFEDVHNVTPHTKEWTEGMCDFMRLFAMRASGMDGEANTRIALYRNAAYQPNAHPYHDYAGRLIRYVEACAGELTAPIAASVISNLWRCDLSKAIPSSLQL